MGLNMEIASAGVLDVNTTSILDLAPELLQNVARCLRDDNLFAFRRTCRILENASMDVFVSRYVSHGRWLVMDPNELRAAKWLLNSRFANKVRSFTLAMTPTWPMDRFGLVSMKGHNLSDEMVLANCYAACMYAENSFRDPLDPAVLMSVLHDLTELPRAKLILDLGQHYPEGTYERIIRTGFRAVGRSGALALISRANAQDILHPIVCSRRKMASIQFSDYHDYDLTRLGIPGMQDLPVAARSLEEIEVELSMDGLLLEAIEPASVTYAQAKEDRQAQIMAIASASNLRGLGIRLMCTLDDQAQSPVCLAITSDLLLANPLSSLHTLDLYNICCDATTFREILYRCIPTLKALTIKSMLVLGEEDCWTDIVKQLQQASGLEALCLRAVCRKIDPGLEVAVFQPDASDGESEVYPDMGVQTACRKKDCLEVASELVHLGRTTWKWRPYRSFPCPYFN